MTGLRLINLLIRTSYVEDGADRGAACSPASPRLISFFSSVSLSMGNPALDDEIYVLDSLEILSEMAEASSR